jgi:hypothetical protein
MIGFRSRTTYYFEMRALPPSSWWCHLAVLQGCYTRYNVSFGDNVVLETPLHGVAATMRSWSAVRLVEYLSNWLTLNTSITSTHIITLHRKISPGREHLRHSRVVMTKITWLDDVQQHFTVWVPDDWFTKPERKLRSKTCITVVSRIEAVCNLDV